MIEGIDEGDELVVQGQILIDTESSMRTSLIRLSRSSIEYANSPKQS